jgi:hypothetical protein
VNNLLDRLVDAGKSVDLFQLVLVATGRYRVDALLSNDARSSRGGTVRKLVQIAALVMLVMGLVGTAGAGVAAAAGFSFPFTTNNESWRTADGNGNTLVAATYASSGGNPGGAISVSDTFPGAASVFLTPSGFGGDYSSNFGGVLSFDVKSSPAWTEEEQVVLAGTGNGGEPVCGVSSVVPGLSYQNAQFTLDGAELFGGFECSSLATDAEVAEVLSTLKIIVIGGEDGPAQGETTTIDNVNLTGGSALAKQKLTLLKAGTGTGTVTSSPTGLNCGAICSAEYFKGAVVTLTATPASGSTFAGWSGGGCSGTGTCQVTLGADHEVTAIFNTAAGSGSGNPPVGTGAGTLTLKPLTCKKGFKKKKVHGIFKCVKLKKKHHHHHHH